MDDDRLARFLRTGARSAGQQFAQARAAYQRARNAAAVDLPVDDEGKARLVCRRYAERRAVAVDSDGTPSCFESDHPDCEGCREDIRAGRIETW